MRRYRLRPSVFAVVLASMAACDSGRSCAHPAGGGDAAPHAPPTASASTKSTAGKLAPFTSEDDIRHFLGELAESAASLPGARSPHLTGVVGSKPPATAADEANGENESIAGTQHPEVDEGGIVKVHGEHLIVLRRGRLFTVRLGAASLTPVAAVDAFGPDVDPTGTWYDEMLVTERTVIVVGYGYQRGGTELGLFDLTSEGQLRHRATYHLRATEYGSARNRASRLVGGKLVFYTPLRVRAEERDPRRFFPAIRRWRPDASEADFLSILAPTHVYRPVDTHPDLTLHTVTTCSVDEGELTCTARAVMGPPARVFYVSPNAVYVWTSARGRSAERTVSEPNRALLYRLPLTGDEPGVLRVGGVPFAPSSFEEEESGHLDVFVRALGGGSTPWSSDAADGDVALLRLPRTAFDREASEVPGQAYVPLPHPGGTAPQSRFVGGHLLYGVGAPLPGKPTADGRRLFVHRVGSVATALGIPLGHPVDRIEALGRGAVVVGGDVGGLHLSSIALPASDPPRVVDRYTRSDVERGEQRSHGFFYQAEGDGAGLLGLTLRTSGSPGDASFRAGSASVLFLRNDALHFTELGRLDAAPAPHLDDACRASCEDWYGNARPIFLHGRTLALLGYELVEGRLDGGRLREARRASFAPAAGKR